MTKKILDVTCGSRTMWFNKNHPAAIYCDVRDEECTGVWKSTNRDSVRDFTVTVDLESNGEIALVKDDRKKAADMWNRRADNG